MNNELVKIEENTLIVAQEMVNKIKELENEKKIIEEIESNFKSQLEEIMSKNNLVSYESPDKTLKISYTPETETTIFDSKKFQEENGDIYRKYLKTSKRKGSIRITVRENK